MVTRDSNRKISLEATVGAIYCFLTLLLRIISTYYLCVFFQIFFLFVISYPSFFAANNLTTKRFLSRTIYVFYKINLGFLSITCILFNPLFLICTPCKRGYVVTFSSAKKNLVSYYIDGIIQRICSS